MSGALKSLHGLLTSAVKHCETHKIEPSALLTARLYRDMFSLTGQVQIATDLGRRGMLRLQGEALTSVPDNEESFDALLGRVSSKRDYLASFISSPPR